MVNDFTLMTNKNVTELPTIYEYKNAQYNFGMNES